MNHEQLNIKETKIRSIITNLTTISDKERNLKSGQKEKRCIIYRERKIRMTVSLFKYTQAKVSGSISRTKRKI